MKNRKLLRAMAGFMASLMLFSGAGEYAFASNNAIGAENIISQAEAESISGNIIIADDSELASYAASDDAWKYFVRDKSDDKIITGVKSEYLNEKSFVIPAKAEKIAKKAFTGCRSLTEVSFASGSKLTEISESAFDGVDALKKITLPSSLKVIGESAFEGTSLTGITIPASVKKMGKSSFEDVNTLEKIEFETGSLLKEIPEKAFDAKNDKLTVLILPENLEKIGSRAFSGYEKLQGVTIPEKVTVIESFAFEKCGLETVSVNSLVLSNTEHSIFSGCKIGKIEFNPNLTVIPAHLFEGAGFCKATINIPAKVKEIGEAAFKQGQSQSEDGIVAVNMGASVKKIGKEAFYGSSISEIGFSNKLKEIGDGAFQECKKLSCVSIPSGISRIGKLAFKNCSALKTVYLPKGTKYSIAMDRDDEENSRIPFDGCPKGLMFYVVKGSYGYSWCESVMNLPETKTNSFKYLGFEYKVAYNITYNIGDGAINNAKNPGLNLGTGNIELYTPRRDGYKFLKWQINSVAYLPDANGITQIPVAAANIKFKAVWEKIPYTVTFDPNGGELKTTTKNYTIGKQVTFKKPKKAGYVFDGWYNGCVKVTKLKKGVYYGGDITLVAHWKEGTYTIHFDGNGATSGEMDDVVCRYNEEVKLPKNQFKKEGYVFDGWSGKGDWQDEDIVYHLKPKGVITLKAKWEKKD